MSDRFYLIYAGESRSIEQRDQTARLSVPDTPTSGLVQQLDDA